MSESKTPPKSKNATISTVPDGEATPIVKGSHVYLIDGSGYIFRAFHALPPLTRPSDGMPVGAVHGFCDMLWKLLRETKASEAPTHMAVVFDAGRETFPQRDLRSLQGAPAAAARGAGAAVPAHPRRGQGLQRRLHRAGGLRGRRLIATYARDVVDAGGDVTIVSSDKDLMQLVRPGVVMFDAMKGKKHRARGGDARSSACRPTRWSTCRRLPAIRSTTCRACRASASRPRPS